MTKVNVIYENAMVDICHDASKLCYKSKPEKTHIDKLKYIEKKVKAGHESILEHSNIIILVTIDDSDRNLIDFMEVMASSRHLNYKMKSENDVISILIGGSVLAYKQIIRNIKNSNNVIVRKLLNELATCTWKEFFYDLIIAGIMNPNEFIDSEIDNGKKCLSLKVEDTDVVEFTNIDPVQTILNKINKISAIYHDRIDMFEYDDILDLVTITVYFKSVARIITQQITRHRNAISQQSQRYVEEKNSLFLSPFRFEEKKMELDNIDDIENNIMSTYNSLLDQGVKKEDARYYLPQGIESSLYMTFTYRSFFHFLKVRTDSHAQTEVREIAKALEFTFDNFVKGIDLSNEYYLYLDPKYILAGELEYNVEKYINNIE